MSLAFSSKPDRKTISMLTYCAQFACLLLPHGWVNFTMVKCKSQERAQQILCPLCLFQKDSGNLRECPVVVDGQIGKVGKIDAFVVATGAVIVADVDNIFVA